jgi:hypothetical protein
MAKLKLSDDLLLSALFPDQVGLEIRAASHDYERQVIEVDIFGPTVPADAAEVVAVITMRARTTTFQKVR